MMSAGRIRPCDGEERRAAHVWRRLEAVCHVPPEARRLCDEAVFAEAPAAAVKGLLSTEQLRRHARTVLISTAEELNREAGRRVAVEVRRDQAHWRLTGGRRRASEAAEASDRVHALRRWRVRRALRHVVLNGRAEAPHGPQRVQMRRRRARRWRRVLLKPESELVDELKGLVSPRDRLVRIEQAPAMVARELPAGVGAQVARRVVLCQRVHARLLCAHIVEADARRAVGQRVLVDQLAARLAEGRRLDGADARGCRVRKQPKRRAALACVWKVWRDEGRPRTDGHNQVELHIVFRVEGEVLRAGADERPTQHERAHAALNRLAHNTKRRC
eukprot:6195640-Pleurochrysis_carterae.AAC.2